MITSLRELAQLANVSKATASLALRNDPHLAVSTRERIQKLAKQHGYRADPVTATLMSVLRVSRKVRSAEKLAYLTSWKTRDGWKRFDNDRRYFEGAKQRAYALGYDLEDFWTKAPGLSNARLSQILNARGIRGVVIAPLPARGHFSLNWPHFAAATIAETLEKPVIHRSMHNYYRAIILAMRHLKRYGYRRIGLAIPMGQDNLVNNAWLAGYLAYNYQHPSPGQPEPFFISEWSKQAARKWIDRHRPDVILSNTIFPLETLRDLKFKVPEEIGFARLDLTSEGSPWAGIDQFPEQIGAAAVDLVVVQLQNNEFGLPLYPKTQMINGIWRDGPTILTSRPKNAGVSRRRKSALVK